MKIAVYCDSFPVLSETFVINQIIELTKLGVSVDIFTSNVMCQDITHQGVLDYNLMSKVTSPNIDVRISRIKKMFKLFKYILNCASKGKIFNIFNILNDKLLDVNQKLKLLKQLSKNDSKNNYENIICHFGTNGYYVCKMREIGVINGPISTVFHGYELSKNKVLRENIARYKSLFEKGDIMLPVSNLWKSNLIELGCDKNKIIVHRMGINISDFEFLDASRELGKPIKVIQVGRLTEKKAILNSIQAMIRLSKVIDIEFTIIGDGELYQDAEKLIGENNANGYIHLLGKQKQDTVREHLRRSDVFILPSVTAADGDMEGVPVALMEAMAMGILVLSTVHSGIPELITTGENGFLVEENDISAIYETILKIKELTTDEISQIRSLARNTCVRSFNNKSLSEDMIKLTNGLSK